MRDGFGTLLVPGPAKIKGHVCLRIGTRLSTLTWTHLELQCAAGRLETHVRFSCARMQQNRRCSGETWNCRKELLGIPRLGAESKVQSRRAPFEVPCEASEPRSCGCWQVREELPVFSFAGRCTSASTSRKGAFAAAGTSSPLSWSFRFIARSGYCHVGPLKPRGFGSRAERRRRVGVKSQEACLAVLLGFWWSPADFRTSSAPAGSIVPIRSPSRGACSEWQLCVGQPPVQPCWF